ncbi:LUD domain-containing protein [Tunturiibacter empetritectus]|uniref:L-lactate dehydrogenase complex protein LldG n=2 Tax=Tunturiibacter TaxID=3154218 RepID=A0A852VC39_9BACT|nr:LUD domain-containing protein [Edaphobacter lichenicola]NYF89027.1 L-lactate dehydrogenase complex protein LldG [Edaphobacter lichenicola]
METDLVTNSRVGVLRRVRAATGRASDGVAARVGWDGIAREYRRRGTLEREGVLALLEDRLRDYDARVFRVVGEDVGQSVAERLVERGVRRMVVPVGLPAAWMSASAAVEYVVDEGLSSEELDGVDGVMTGATLAIAETGTFVLQGVAGQGRRAATLVPDYHLCVVRAEDVVETVPEAMGRLQGTAGLATTFVSGPSATADIEMTRIKGVHGPQFLDVLLIV